MFESFFESPLFSIGDRVFLLGPTAITALIALLAWIIFRWLKSRVLRAFYQRNQVTEQAGRRFYRILRSLFLLLVIIAAVWMLDLNHIFFPDSAQQLSVMLIIQTLLIVQFARFLDWIISNILIHKYYVQRDRRRQEQPSGEKAPASESTATRIVQYILYVLVAILILRNFNLDLSIYDFKLNDGEVIPFRISNILSAILVVLIARLLVWLMTQLILYGFYKQKKIDVGVQFALNQLLSYVIYTVATIIALQHLGINMTLIWGGAAALLVGIGLGLQQTFNDFFSGIVLLFERTVKIGDILDVDGHIGTVKRIGLRSSIIETWGNVTVVVPNSKLVSQNVTNWTHFDDKVRFEVKVGVAYGSDTQLVRELLLTVARLNPYVIDYPAPFVRLNDFGNNSLDFSLYFFSRNYMVIEDIKSDIRFAIDKQFRANDIVIPFPQRDVWIRQIAESTGDA